MTAPSPSQWPQQPSAPSPGGQPPGQKNRKPLLIAGILGGAGCLVALLVVIALVIVLAVNGGGTGGAEGEGEGESESGLTDATPEEQIAAVVTEYMDALGAGDSATALELAPPLDESAALLSAEAYDAALQAAPVADVEIAEPVMEYSSSGVVDVTYTLDGEPLTHEFTVYSESDDTWVISMGLGTSSSVPASVKGLGFTLNGEEVESEESLFLLPGAYTPAIGAEHFTLSSDDPITVADEIHGLRDLEPALSEDGLGVFRKAVQGAVDDCLAQTTLEAGCGIGTLPSTTSDGWTITEDTVRRSLSEEGQRKIDTMEATPRYDEPTVVEGTSIGTITTEMDCTKDGQQGICEMVFGGGMSRPYVDMADPDLAVTWS